MLFYLQINHTFFLKISPKNKRIIYLFLPSVASAQRSLKPFKVVGFKLLIYQLAPPPSWLLAVTQLDLISRSGGAQACGIWDSLCFPKQLEKSALILQS